MACLLRTKRFLDLIIAQLLFVRRRLPVYDISHQAFAKLLDSRYRLESDVRVSASVDQSVEGYRLRLVHRHYFNIATASVRLRIVDVQLEVDEAELNRRDALEVEIVGTVEE